MLNYSNDLTATTHNIFPPINSISLVIQSQIISQHIIYCNCSTQESLALEQCEQHQIIYYWFFLFNDKRFKSWSSSFEPEGMSNRNELYAHYKKKTTKNSRTFTTPLDKTRRAAYQLVAINETKRVLIYGFWLQVV